MQESDVQSVALTLTPPPPPPPPHYSFHSGQRSVSLSTCHALTLTTPPPTPHHTHTHTWPVQLSYCTEVSFSQHLSCTNFDPPNPHDCLDLWWLFAGYAYGFQSFSFLFSDQLIILKPWPLSLNNNSSSNNSNKAKEIKGEGMGCGGGQMVKTLDLWWAAAGLKGWIYMLICIACIFIQFYFQPTLPKLGEWRVNKLCGVLLSY